MTWFASSANQAEAQKESYFMFLAASLDFPSGTARFWTGAGDLVIAGQTFIGMGKFVGVSPSSERSNMTTERRTYRLSGVDPTIVLESDLENCFGREVIEYFGFLNPETRQLLDTPEENWRGEMSNAGRRDGREPLIEVNAEHYLHRLDETDGWRYTHEHQQQFYLGDLGLNQVHKIEMQEVFWGGDKVRPGVAPPGGGSGRIRPPSHDV